MTVITSSAYNRKTIAALVVGLVMCYIAFFYMRFAGPELSIAFAQKYVAPFVFLVIGTACFLMARVPIVVFLSAAALAGIGIGLGFGYSEFHDATVVVARLQNDDLETQSRIFREQVREAVPQDSGVEIVRYHTSLEQSTARQFLQDNPSLPLVVWQDGSFLKLSFREEDAIELKDLIPIDTPTWRSISEDVRIPLSKQRFIKMIPYVRVPLEPIDATARYLADVSAGSLAGYSSGSFAAQKPEARVLDLEIAVARGASWKSQSHRAFAAFLLGNYYFGQAFSGEFQPGYLDCAIKEYAVASGLVRADQNYALYSAIFNNLGVIRSMQVYFEDMPEAAKLARRNFLNAQKAAPGKDAPSSELVAYRAASKNFAKMAVLRGNTEREGKKRRKLAKQNKLH